MAATVVGPSGPGSCQIELGAFSLAAARGATSVIGATRVAIRPERVRLAPAAQTGPNHVPGTVERAVYLGNATQLAVRLGDGLTVQALIQNSGDDLPFRPGDAVSVHLPAEALRVLDRSPAEEPPMNPPFSLVVAAPVPTPPLSDALRDERRRRFPIGTSLSLADLEDFERSTQLLAQLREREPVTWVEAVPGWLVTPRALVEEVLSSHDRFTVRAESSLVRLVLGDHMLTHDGERHRYERAPYDPPFRLRPVRANYTEMIERRVADLLGPLEGAGGRGAAHGLRQPARDPRRRQPARADVRGHRTHVRDLRHVRGRHGRLQRPRRRGDDRRAAAGVRRDRAAQHRPHPARPRMPPSFRRC